MVEFLPFYCKHSDCKTARGELLSDRTSSQSQGGAWRVFLSEVCVLSKLLQRSAIVFMLPLTVVLASSCLSSPLFEFRRVALSVSCDRYKFVDSEEELHIQTTRPETMLGDTGVAVHPDVSTDMTGRPTMSASRSRCFSS